MDPVPSVPSESVARKQILTGFAIVFATGFVAGLIGYVYGIGRGPDGDYSVWTATLTSYNVKDHFAFMKVAYIHNASYIGGFLGLVFTYVVIRPPLDHAVPDDGDVADKL